MRQYLIDQGVKGFSKPKKEPVVVVEPCFISASPDNFKAGKNLEDQVNSGDLSMIRAALFLELSDRKHNEGTLQQMMSWTETKQNSLFDPYEENSDALPVNYDKSTWSDNYYYLQEVYAKSNFSRKRLEHLINVRMHLSSRPGSQITGTGENNDKTQGWLEENGADEIDYEHVSVSGLSNSGVNQKTVAKKARKNLIKILAGGTFISVIIIILILNHKGFSAIISQILEAN